MSSLWEKIRERTYKEKGSKCSLCLKEARCIHHRGYGRDVLEGKDLSPLVPLCIRCHEYIEFNKVGVKLSLKNVEKKFNRLLGKYKKNEKAKKTAAVKAKRVKKGKSWCACGRLKKYNKPTCKVCKG